MGELRALLGALPKEVAAQILSERTAVDKVLDDGHANFKEIFHRLAKLEKAMLAMYILVALVVIGKGVAWVLGALHIV